MSNAVFPTLPGIAWPVIKIPEWSTKVQKSASGRELRAAFFSYPLWRFRLTFNVLRQADLTTLAGFFNARQGSFDTFLFLDPVDNSVTNQNFGVGDGTTKKFQLARTYGGVVEPVFGAIGTPAVKVNGVSTGAFTIDNNACVTFTTAPAAGAVLSWTGQYYFRCRFVQDSSEFEQFMSNLWNLKKLEFITVKQ